MGNTKKLPVDTFIKMLERYLLISFPKEYRNFLLGYKDEAFLQNKKYFILDKNLNTSSSVDGFFHITDNYDYSILENYKIYKGRIPNNLFPIADDPFGNLILLSVKNTDRGKIYFWDHEEEVGEGEVPDYSNLTLIADSFDEFINNLQAEEEI